MVDGLIKYGMIGTVIIEHLINLVKILQPFVTNLKGAFNFRGI